MWIDQKTRTDTRSISALQLALFHPHITTFTSWRSRQSVQYWRRGRERVRAKNVAEMQSWTACACFSWQASDPYNPISFHFGSIPSESMTSSNLFDRLRLESKSDPGIVGGQIGVWLCPTSVSHLRIHRLVLATLCNPRHIFFGDSLASFLLSRNNKTH